MSDLRELSEANGRLNGGGTAGPLAEWTAETPPETLADTASLESGVHVRLGANHTHARSNQASLGEVICAPAPAAGGTALDRVGHLIAYPPFDDGASVDVAARTTTDCVPVPSTVLDDTPPASVHRGPQSELLGVTVRKVGSRTGVTTGRIIATDATVVTLNTATGRSVQLVNVLLATLPVAGDDSGAAVYSDDHLVGMVSSALDDVAIICHAPCLEAALGVELLPV